MSTLSAILRDAVYGARRLRASPLSTAVAIGTLGLGLGVSTAVFGSLSAAWSPSQPIGDAAGLVAIRWQPPMRPGALVPLSLPEYRDFLERRDLFEGVLAFVSDRATVAIDGDYSRIVASYVSDTYFETLRLQPEAGQLLLPGDMSQGDVLAPAVISERFWRTRFGGAPAALGSVIRVSGRPATIVGVAQRGFRGLFAPGLVQEDVWLPLALLVQADWHGARIAVAPEDRSSRTLDVRGRLAEGVTFDQALSVLGGVEDALRDADRGRAAELRLVMDRRGADGWTSTRDAFGSAALPLFVLAGLVFAVACLNVGSLLVARAVPRVQEFAVRMALGASGARVVRQLMTEYAVLSWLGMAAGLAVAAALMWVVANVVQPGIAGVEISIAPSLDHAVLFFVLALGAASVLCFGLWPAVHVSRQSVLAQPRGGATLHATTGGGGRVAQQAVVVVVFAMSAALVTIAGLLARPVLADAWPRAGLDGADAALFAVDLSPGGHGRETALDALRRILDRGEERGIWRHAAVVSDVPLGRSPTTFLHLDDGRSFEAALVGVSPSFFETFGLPVIRGRGVTGADDPGSPRVAVLSQSLARDLFGQADAIGQRFRRSLEAEESIGIVGVSADLAGAATDRRRVVYVPIEQHNPRDVLIVAASNVPAQHAAAMGVIREFEPDVIVSGATTIRRYLLEQMYGPLVVSAVTGILAGIVLLLACAGLFALMSDVAASRRRELGVRLALGATRLGIARLVVWNGTRLVIAGTAVGLACAAMTAGILSRFGVAVSLDPTVFLLVALLLGTVALLAACGPARRASAVDPMSVLRTVD